MLPVEHPGATRHLGAPVNWDPAQDGPCATLPIADLVDEERHAVMESLWRPDAVEIAALAAGGAVILRIHGVSHPVVSLGVTAAPIEGEAEHG